MDSKLVNVKLFPDTFNLTEKSCVPVTRKPPVGVNKKMTQKGDQLIDYYHEEDDRVYCDTSARSSPGVRRRSYDDKEEEMCQDDLQSARSSPGGRRRSCHEAMEETNTELGQKNYHDSGDDDWILVDPKTDREFMDTIRRRILQCVSTNSCEEERDHEEDREEEALGRNAMNEAEEEDWLEREKNDLRSSMCSLPVIEDNGWDVKEDLRIVSRNDDETNNLHDGALENTIELNDYPSRQLVTTFLRECSLFEEDEHRQELMNMVKSYIKKIKKEKILGIVEKILSEEEDNTEDAVFLISEVLYGK